MKVYLCGITSAEKKNIKQLTDPIYEHIDGLNFVVDDSGVEDGTFDLLNERRGEGKILQQSWLGAGHHDWTMNLWLYGSGLKEGDWAVFRDSMERFNPKWAKNIKNFLASYEMAGIRSIYNYGKIFAFKWNDSLFFQGSPHFGLHGAQGKSN